MIASRPTNFWQLPSQLLVAIDHGDIKRCSELLAAGADCDQLFKINRQMIPAICIGVQRGFTQLVELFIRSGSSVNRRDSEGRTPLHTASEMGFVGIGELLVQHRAYVNAVDDHGVSPLHLACKRCNIAFVRLLITHGADVNRQDARGKTPLMYCCSAPTVSVDIVQELLNHGAEPDVADKSGWTPLLCALYSPRYSFDAVEALINRGARVDLYAPSHPFKAPIHLVVESDPRNPDKYKVLRLVLERCENMNLLTVSCRQSAVQIACMQKDVRALRLLLCCGADPNTRDVLGGTPLLSTAVTGSQDMVQLLVRGGVRATEGELKNAKLAWAKPLLMEPLSLKDISRQAISKSVGGRILKWLDGDTEEIPSSLKPFLLLEDS